MATSRTSDVSLVIRARNEADAAITAVRASLNSLGSDAAHTESGVASLATALGALDKANAAIAAAQERAGASATKQARAAHDAATGLEEQRARVETLTRALAALRAEQQAGGVDAQRSSEIKNYIAQAERGLSAAETQLRRISTIYDRSISGVQAARSGLLGLRRSSTDTAEAQTEVAARIELTTQALKEQDAAARGAAAAQTFYNTKAAPGLVNAPSRAADSAALLQQADQEFERRVQAQVAQRQREAAAIRDAAEANAGVTGTRATDAGAGFSALAAREEAEAVRQAGLAHQEFERRVRAGANAMREADAAEEALTRDSAALRSELNPLAAIQDRYNASLERFRALAAAGKISTEELVAAQSHAAREAETARAALNKTTTNTPGFLGLKPYELQNLSYQINDVVTQLASGTSLSQTLAQQGGQIFQLFPKVGGVIVGALKNPAILGFIAALGTIALGLKVAGDNAERLRSFTTDITFKADGGAFDPQKLADEAQALEQLGAKAKDAEDAVKGFLDAAINPELLQQFGRIALETSQVLGTDLKQAAQDVAAAFTGGYDAIARYDDKLNFLTAAERAHIRTLFEEGNANAARVEALNAYTRQSDAAAAKQRGPWGEAVRSLGGLYHSLTSELANSPLVRGLTFVFDELARAIKSAADGVVSFHNGIVALQGGSGDLPATIARATDAARAKAIADTQATIKALNASIASAQDDIDKKSPIAGYLTRLVENLKRQRDQAASKLAGLEKTAPDTLADDPNGVAAKQRADDLTRIGREDELQRLRDAGQQRLLTVAERARREELAGQDAAKSATDAVVAAAERRRAVAHETAAIEKESDARAKQNLAERNKAIADYERAVIAAEGGGKNRAGSSAAGYGQFTESTYLRYYNRAYGDTGQSRSDVLGTRNDPTIAKGVLDAFTRENAKTLEGFGATVKAGNLYLAHIFGTGRDGGPTKAIINAAADTPVDQILARFDNFATIAKQNAGYLRVDGGKGRYRTAGELREFVGKRVNDDTGSPQAEGQVALGKLIDDSKTKQNEFNLAVAHGNEERSRGATAAKAEFGLYGTALLNEQKRQAIAKEVLDLVQKTEDANKSLKPGQTPIVVTDEQLVKTKALAAALFDAQHAAAALNAQQADRTRPLEGLQEQLNLLTQQEEQLRSVGENGAADKVRRQADALRPSIRAAIDELIAFYQALSPEQRVSLGILDENQLDNIIAKLKLARAASQEWGKVLGISGQQVAQALGGAIASSFTNFIQKVAQGKNVFKSLGESVAEFAASFIQSIAQMIIQLLAYAAAVSILRALGVPVPTGAAGVFHEGGVVGDGGGATRQTSMVPWMGALRYHNGGMVGLLPDEVPIIAKRGEEVLTAADARHRANGGANVAASSPGNVTLINVADHDTAVQQALRRPAGEKVLLNFMSDNATAVKAALG